MGALFYAGVLTPLALMLLLAVGFFVQAWLNRRAHGENLLLGLLCLPLAGYSAAMAAAYWRIGTSATTPALRALADLSALFGVVAIPLLVHFALRHVRSVHERRIMRVFYPLSALYLLLLLAGHWWKQVPSPAGTMSLLGFDVPLLSGEATLLASTFYLVSLVSLAAVCVMLLRSYLRRRNDGLTAFLGALALLVAAANDTAALALGWYGSISLAPMGFGMLAFGMSLTLVTRYGNLSTALGQRKAQLRQRSDELAKSLKELQQTQEELVHSEQLAVVGEFAAVITHEVRNPMAIVSNAVSTLRRFDEVTDDTRSLLGIIEGEMLRLERLVTHLLNYARPVVPQRQQLVLQLLLSECLASLEQLPDVDCSLTCDGQWPTVYVDKDMIVQVFDNILANAVQAMDARGDLRIRVARRRVKGIRSVVIGFEDTGEGMTEHQLEQVRSPFYTTRPSGTGLGLAICDRIIDAHGGALHVRSEHGAGTAVTVILPERPDERFDVAGRDRLHVRP